MQCHTRKFKSKSRLPGVGSYVSTDLLPFGRLNAILSFPTACMEVGTGCFSSTKCCSCVLNHTLAFLEEKSSLSP